MDVDRLLAQRDELMKSRPNIRLSLNHSLIKACVAALVDVPEINVNWGESVIRKYDSTDISAVMSIDGGLVRPIIYGAYENSIWEISNEVRELREAR